MTVTARCKHYWYLMPAHGAHSPGRCLLCGEEREFANTIEQPKDWQIRLGKRAMVK